MSTSPSFWPILLILFTMRAACLGWASAPAEEMAGAAQAFLAALTPEQKSKATFGIKDDERLNWHFVPKARKGLSFKDMTPDQRPLAFALLASGLSQRGFVKATTIMSLEQILKEVEQGKGPVRDPEQYFVSIFGTPGPTEAWGWRFEGHHLALNFTLAGGKNIAVSPSFMGSNPGEVRQGSRQGLRVLAAEEDLARKLVQSLTPEQKKVAIYTNVAPADILSAANRKATPLAPEGISMRRLKKDQSELLRQVIEEYVFRCRPELAQTDMEKIRKTGTDKIHFAWGGSTEPGQGHYYRVQGPSFLLEYDNTQNNANHVHAVWRDFNGDFGEDILRQHYDQAPHGR